MLRGFLFLLTFGLVHLNAQAASIKALQNLITDQHKGEQTSSAAGLALTAYYSGVADGLLSQMDSTRILKFTKDKNICIPTNEKMNSDFIKNTFEFELKTIDINVQVFGVDWREMSPLILILWNFQRNFPCP